MNKMDLNKLQNNMTTKYYSFFLGRFCGESFVSILLPEILMEIFSIKFNEWKYLTPEKVLLSPNKLKITKIGGIC
jgi:hypothetical protein